MIHRAGAGPAPIHHKDLNPDNLCAAITYAISPEAKTAAAEMAKQITSEVRIPVLCRNTYPLIDFH